MRKNRLFGFCVALLWLCVGTASAVEPKDTTVTVTEAGTLKDVFPGKDWTTQEECDSVMQTFTSLKIIGPINGTDIPYLQTVCGSFSGTSGNISELDLSEANIVSGGDSYGIYFSPTGDMVDLFTKDGEIGMQMFYFCGALTKLTLPLSTVSIAANAFEGSLLESLTVPEGNTLYKTVDGVLFDYDMKQLLKYPALKTGADYVVPQTVSVIGDNAFQSASKLFNITLPDGLTDIGEYAFSNSYLKSVASMPSSMHAIGTRAFSGCQKLTSAVLPSSVEDMGTGVFMGCTALKAIAVPEGATDLTQMFYGCKNLVNASLPKTITTIGDMAFQSCESLEKVTIQPGVTAIGASSFDGCSSLASLTIPEGVTTIGQRAFASCKALNYLSLPSTLESVGDYFLSFASSNMSLVVAAAEPPAVSSHSFYPSPYGITLYVPDASVSDYQAAEGWSAFSTIMAMSEAPENPDKTFNILAEEYVPDPIFRAWIDSNLAGGTGVYTNEEASAYDGEIYIGYTEVKSLEGIGYFTNLTSFCITNNNNLTSVDLTQNTKLRKIYAMYSKSLEQLNIEGLDSLEAINIGVTALTSFDLSQHMSLAKGLRELNLMQLNLTEIDVTPFVNLESLDLSCNKLKSIDCEGLSKLKMFSCSNITTLTSVNLHGCVALEELIASMCPNLASLDISGNPAITAIYVHEDKLLGNFDFSAQKRALEYLNVGNTGRTELDLTGCTNLVELEFPSNPLEAAPNLSDCTELTWLRAESCGLKTIDVSKLTKLTEFYCYDNSLERLDISKNTKLVRLICNNNAMSEIKVWRLFDLNNPPIDYNKDSNANFVYEFTTDGIYNANLSDNLTEVSRYGIDGRKAVKGQLRFSIIKMSDGTTRKVIK